MHHHLHHSEKSFSLSFIRVSGPGEFSRVESNYLDRPGTPGIPPPGLGGIPVVPKRIRTSLFLAFPPSILGSPGLCWLRAPARSTLAGGSSTYLKASPSRGTEITRHLTARYDGFRQSPTGRSPRDCLRREFPRSRLSRRPSLNLN